MEVFSRAFKCDSKIFESDSKHAMRFKFTHQIRPGVPMFLLHVINK